MATADRPSTHREELALILDEANRQFALTAVLVTLGAPIAAYLSGHVPAMFYVHVALGAFWFGLDFFFKFVLGPALDAAPDEAASSVNRQLVPKMTVVAEPLSLGVVASGIGLAELLGYWQSPTVWLWGALGLAALMLLNGFGPLHFTTTRMAVELTAEDLDEERLDDLLGTTMQWGMLQTILMLGILLTMVGLRNVGL